MAIGEAATSVGYILVPDTGEDGKVKWGSREINRTRDYVANLKQEMPSNKAEFREALGITISEDAPVPGDPYDIHFQLLPEA